MQFAENELTENGYSIGFEPNVIKRSLLTEEVIEELIKIKERKSPESFFNRKNQIIILIGRRGPYPALLAAVKVTAPYK